MTLKEIREEAWRYANDIIGGDDDRLWPKAEMNAYINRVYRRIASETLCIRDSSTVDVCQISSNVVDYTTYVAGTKDYIWANDPENWLYQKNVAPYLYTMHPSILKVEEVKWVSRAWKLTKVNVGKWQVNPFWERVVGMPTEYATDLETGKLAVNFRSEANDTLAMVVRRLPLANLVADGDEPEFRPSYHEFFLNGVLSLMYLKQDVESFDQGKADHHRQLFLLDIDEIKQQESQLDQTINANGSHLAFR